MTRPILDLPWISVPVDGTLNDAAKIQLSIRAKSPNSTSGLEFKYKTIIYPPVDGISVSVDMTRQVTFGNQTGDHHIVEAYFEGGHTDAFVYHSNWQNWDLIYFSTVSDIWSIQSGNDSTSKKGKIYWELTKLNTPILQVIPANNYKYNSNIRYSWQSVAGANSYEVLVSGSDGSWSYSSVNTYKDDTFNASHVGKYYSVKVRAIADSPESYAPSDWSEKGFTIAGTYKLIDGLNTSIVYHYQIATSWSEGLYTPPTKANYTFAGWYDAVSGGNRIRSWTASSGSSDLVLYAHWNASNYTIQLDPQGGTIGGSSNVKSYSVVVGSSFTFDKTVVAPEGKVLKGWSKTTDGEVEHTIGESYTPAKSEKWYAIYGENSTISFNLNAPIIVGSNPEAFFTPSPSSIATMTKKYGDSITLPEAPTCTGFTFKGWKNGSITYDAGTNYNVEGSATLQAQWENNKYQYTEIAPSPGPNLPDQTQEAKTWEFNTTITLPSAWEDGTYDDDVWTPKVGGFWKLINGTSTTISDAGNTFYYNNQEWTNDENKIQSQWSKLTSWRSGTLWIYIP